MCTCTSTAVCVLCTNKHLYPIITKAHRNGTAILNRDFVVTDPTINQDGRKLTSLLFPIVKRVQSGQSVDIADKPWHKKGLDYLAKQTGVLVKGTVVSPVPRLPVMMQLGKNKERGVLLSSLSCDELVELDKLVKERKAHVCDVSGAAFSFTESNDASSSVTFATILWNTSRVKSFCNGESFKIAASDAPSGSP